jgi:putative transposase
MMAGCMDQRGWGILGRGVAAHGAPPTYKNRLRTWLPNAGGAPCAATPVLPWYVGGAPCAAIPHSPPDASAHPGLCPPTDDPHSAHLRAFRRMAGGGTFLVTKCLEPRRPLLVDDAAVAVAETICHEARRGRMLLAAFVVMPDHWHAVIGILPADSLSKRMGVISKWVSQKMERSLASTGVRLQDGYHDMRIRSSKQFSFSVDYARDNPVRDQLVERADDWPHSSLNPLYADAILAPWPWRFEHDE